MSRIQKIVIVSLVILLVAGLLLVRLMLDLNELRRQMNTRIVVDRVGRQVEMFREARGFLPEGLDQMLLEVPKGFTDSQGDPVDAWGYHLLYHRAGRGRSEQYVIASPGRDGDFDESPDQYLHRRGYTSNRGHPNRDTILVGGKIVQGPDEVEPQ